MKLIEKWVIEGIKSLKNDVFTLDELKGVIIDKKGSSIYIGSPTQLAHYCKRHARKVSPGTYRRSKYQGVDNNE